MEKKSAIDPFGSEGFEIDLLVENNTVVGVSPRLSYVNKFGLINDDIKNNFEVFNRKDRIKTPLLKIDGKLCPITKKEAIELIAKVVAETQLAKNAVFASPEMTNELLYSVQKLARCGFKTNSINSFHYLDSGTAFNLNKNDNVPLHEMIEAKQIFIFGTNLDVEHSVIGQIVQNCRVIDKVPCIFIGNDVDCRYSTKVDECVIVSDYLSFIKAVNYYVLKHNYAGGIFTNSVLSIGFTEYKTSILSEDFDLLLKRSGVEESVIERFVDNFLAIQESVIILSEKSVSKEVFLEIKNLMLLTERQAKPASGMLDLKVFCNSQGLFDIGILPEYGPGYRKFEGEYVDLLRAAWNIADLPNENIDMVKNVERNFYDNIFIFGENPMKTHRRYAENIQNAKFVCTQALFENETTEISDLVLPMNFAIEIGGSYTSSFKIVQSFSPVVNCNFGWNDYSFFSDLHEKMGLSSLNDYSDIFFEFAQFLKSSCSGGKRHKFEIV